MIKPPSTVFEQNRKNPVGPTEQSAARSLRGTPRQSTAICRYRALRALFLTTAVLGVLWLPGCATPSSSTQGTSRPNDGGHVPLEATAPAEVVEEATSLANDMLSFETQVLRVSSPVMVNFYTPWCGGCRQIAPIIDALLEEYAGQVKQVKVHAGEALDVIQKQQIIGTPTLIFYVDGREVKRLIGPKFEAQIREGFELVAGSGT